MKNTLEKLYESSKDAAAYAEGYAKYMSQVIAGLDFKAIKSLCDIFLAARERGSTIFFAGNGGSASTCSHFATDLGNLAAEGARSFRAMSLTDNVSFITALANDQGFENIFLAQLKNIFRPGDVLVAVSGSGNSENLIRAIKYVKENKGTSVGVVGFEGGLMKPLCDHVIHIKTPPREYGPVEDICLIINHMICSYLAYHEGLFTKGDCHPCNRLVTADQP